MKTALVRKAHFNAAHRLYVHTWSEEKNKEIFGKCYNPHYHGHNYEMEVKVIGYPDEETGMLIDLSDLKKIIKEKVEDRYDHKNLNEQLPEFREKNPTIENITKEIYLLIKKMLPSHLELHVKVYETPRNYAEYPA